MSVVCFVYVVAILVQHEASYTDWNAVSNVNTSLSMTFAVAARRTYRYIYFPLKKGSSYTVRWRNPDNTKKVQVLSFATLKEALKCVRRRFPHKELRLRKVSKGKQVAGSDFVSSKKKQKYKHISWHTAANAWFVQSKKCGGPLYFKDENAAVRCVRRALKTTKKKLRLNKIDVVFHKKN